MVSESGSLDRLKSAGQERRKKVPGLEDSNKPTVSGRVEGTRVDADTLIDEILKNKKLDQVEESAESECAEGESVVDTILTFMLFPFSVWPAAVHCERWHDVAERSGREVAAGIGGVQAGGHG